MRVARSQPPAGTWCQEEDEEAGEEEHARAGPSPPAAVCAMWIALQDSVAGGCGGGGGGASGSRVMSATKAVTRPLPLSYRGCCRTMSTAEGAKSQAYTRRAGLVWGRKRARWGELVSGGRLGSVVAPVVCGQLRIGYALEEQNEMGDGLEAACCTGECGTRSVQPVSHLGQPSRPRGRCRQDHVLGMREALIRGSFERLELDVNKEIGCRATKLGKAPLETGSAAGAVALGKGTSPAFRPRSAPV